MVAAFSVGDWHVEPSVRTLTDGTLEVHLEPKVMHVLLVLAEHPGQVVSKEELFRVVWPDTFVGDEVLARAVSELRRVFGDDARSPRYIQTIPKTGYRLVTPVRPGISARPVPGSSQPDGQPAPPVETRPVARRLPLVAAALLVLGGLVVARHFTSVQRPPVVIPPPRRLVRITSLPGVEGFPALSPDGSRVVFAWNGNLSVTEIGSVEVRPLREGPLFAWYPAWSPDGRQIAFLRPNDASVNPRVYVMPILGGPPRVLSDFHADGRIEWSPDGRFILAGSEGLKDADRERGLVAIPLEGGAPRELLGASAPGRLFSPAVSPDGSRMAYAECRQPAGWFEWDIDWHYGGFDCSLNVVQVSATLAVTSRPQQLAAMPLLGGPVWTRDGESVLFFGDEQGTGTTYLWRAFASGSRIAERIDEAGVMVGVPSTARGSDRVVFGRFDTDIDVYQFTRDGGTTPIAASSSNDLFPAYSTDGRHIAFGSERTGAMEIWVADRDGSGVRQLTKGPNQKQVKPTWSPDDRQIAFESVSPGGRSSIWVTDVDAGPPRRITTTTDAHHPRWSRDGRWIYFDDYTDDQIRFWRIPAAGGRQAEILTGTGDNMAESPDGTSIVYQKPRPAIDIGPLVVQSLDGRTLRTVVACARENAFTWTSQGIYYLECSDTSGPGPDGQPGSLPLHLLNPASGEDRVLGVLEHIEMEWQFDLAVSPDGRSVLYARRPMPVRGDLWMLEPFR